MASSCYYCDVDKNTEPCIGCGKYICKAHAAGNNAVYISLDDKKGTACDACVEEGVVGSAKGGIFNIMQPLNRIQYSFESKCAKNRLHYSHDEKLPPATDTMVNTLDGFDAADGVFLCECLCCDC